MQLVRRAVRERLEVHPRVSLQGIHRRERVEALARALPELVPFRDQRVKGAIAVLDWDHRLPSQELPLRLFLGYEDTTVQRMQAVLEERRERITAADRFPEFDVPDFDGLPGDEIYVCPLKPELTFTPSSCRLVSPWRRVVQAEDMQRAVKAAQGGEVVDAVREQLGGRVVHARELEVLGWVPPCESGQPCWGLEVVWILDARGGVVRGYSFLVELDERHGDRALTSRIFQSRLP